MAIRNSLNYYAEFFTVPTAILATLVLMPPASNAQATALAVGFLLWNLTEYWMHRELFHRRYRKEHWVHHLRPTDWEGSAPTVHAHLLLALACLGLCGLLGGSWLGLPACTGFLAGYWLYIVPHHGIHRGWFSNEWGWVARHELHHRGVEANFNILIPLGDLLFGTYKQVTKR